MNIRSFLTSIAPLAASLTLAGCAGSPPANLGYHEGSLLDCPSSPNCVSSYSNDEGHSIAPLPSQGSLEATKKKLLDTLLSQGATIMIDKDRYIRSEFTSSLMGFVDDVEFYIEKDSIAVRSASRLGYSDLGANRKRVEAIREALK